MTSQLSSGDALLAAIAYDACMLAALLDVLNLDVAAPGFAEASLSTVPLHDPSLVEIARHLRDLAQTPSTTAATKRQFLAALDHAERVICLANQVLPYRHGRPHSAKSTNSFLTRSPFVTHVYAPAAAAAPVRDDMSNIVLATLRAKRAEIEHNWPARQHAHTSSPREVPASNAPAPAAPPAMMPTDPAASAEKRERVPIVAKRTRKA